MLTWQDKAKKIIYKECQREYLNKNLLPNGRIRRKHVPYSVPALAEELLNCIKLNKEEEAKAIFLRLALPSLN